MFEFEFCNPCDKSESLSQVLEARPTSFLSFDDIESLRPTFWGEHCVECAMPLCFGTCVHYEARPDKKCKRFEFGIRDNTDAAFADFSYHAEIRFRLWGKLETPIYPGITSVDEALTQNEHYKTLAMEVAFQEAQFEGSVGKEAYASLFNEGYLDGVNVIPDDKLGKNTEFFVFQTYSYSKESFNLMFEVTSLQRLVYRESLHIEPGYNQYVISLSLSTAPFRKLAESRDMLLARIIPENDFEAHIVVLMAEFVNPKQESVVRFLQQCDSEMDFALQSEASRATTGGSILKPQVKMALKPANKVKCVCWDLDNTVWSGTLIEADPEALELRPGVRETMNELDRRGIVQMVVSKNQEEDALPVLKRLGIDEMFVHSFINWNAKSQNLVRIAELLNINLDTFAFIDDQPFERAEVGESIPCVRVFSETDVPALLDDSPFDVPVTQEGSKRRIMYQTEAKRRAIEQGFSGSNIDFIRSCNLKIEILSPKSEAQKKRSYELVHRTNQLNLSGRRYEVEDFAALISGEQGKRTFCVTCSDRFGSYGQVGYMVLELRYRTLFVREFAMSCRVMGKCVENALTSWLVGVARLCEADHVILKGVRTARNELIAKTFISLGFTDSALFEDDIALALSVDTPVAYSDAVNVVDHVSEGISPACLQRKAPFPEGSSEAIVFVPHQDDEVLTCAAGILEAQRSMHDRVAVVLCTDGKNCETRLWLNDGGSCSDLSDDHHFDFTIEEYGALRDAEFRDSCGKLGVSSCAVIIADSRMVDGQVTIEGARRVITAHLRCYPDALVITHADIEPLSNAQVPKSAAFLHSEPQVEHLVVAPEGGFIWASQHRDHRMLAKAALALFDEGVIKNLQLFVEFYHVHQFKATNPNAMLVRRVSVAQDAQRLRDAISAYAAWDPSNRRFALGLHSAHSELLYMQDKLVGYSYFPERKGGSKMRDAAQGAAFVAQSALYDELVEEFLNIQSSNQNLKIESTELNAVVGEIHASTTYKIGQAIMALPCMLKDCLKRRS